MQRQQSLSGPYRATQVWNEVMGSFRSGMPLKKHWWRMKYHEDCFSASEAVTWLQAHLQSQPYFGPTVSRHQALQLLHKFLKAGLFRPLHRHRKCASYSSFKLTDNGDLFRFTEKWPSTSSPTRPALLPLNGPFASTSSSGGSSTSSGTSQESVETPCNNLPAHLVHTAWKEEVLDRLAATLGAVARDIHTSGHWILVNTRRAEDQRATCIEESSKDTGLPHWLLSAMTCLAHSQQDGSREYPGFRGDVFRVVEDHLAALPAPLVPASMQPAFLQALRDALSPSPSAADSLIETSFGGTEPVTRLLAPPPGYMVARVTANSGPLTTTWPAEDLSAGADTARRLRSRSGGYVNPALAVDEDEDCRGKCKDVQLKEAVATLGRLLDVTKKARTAGQLRHVSHDTSSSSSIASSTASLSSSYHTAHSLSQYDASDDASDEDEESIHASIGDLQKEGWWRPPSLPSGTTEMPTVVPWPPTPRPQGNGRSHLEETVQLLLLLLPPDKRRHLHLLARLLHQMHLNPPQGRPISSLLLSRAVLRVEQSSQQRSTEEEEVMARVLLRFLAENHRTVFTPPKDLEMAVRRRLAQVAGPSESKQPKRPCPSNDARTFCARVSREEFERQKEAGSRAALCELLDQILKDPRIKDRAARIQKFREAYPHIFQERFPAVKALGLPDRPLAQEQRQPNARSQEGCLVSKKQKSCVKLFPSLAKIRNLRL